MLNMQELSEQVYEQNGEIFISNIETYYTITRFYVRLTAVISMVLRTVKGG